MERGNELQAFDPDDRVPLAERALYSRRPRRHGGRTEPGPEPENARSESIAKE